MKKLIKPSPVKRRNPLHDSPLLKKGGQHGKTKKAARRGDKVAFKKEWCSPIIQSLSNPKTSFVQFNTAVA